MIKPAITTSSIYSETAVQSQLRPKADAAVRGQQARRILIVGAGARGQDIARELLSRTDSKYEVVGFVDDTVDYFDGIDGIPVLGRFSEALEIAEATSADEMIVAYMPSWQEELIKRAMQRRSTSWLEINRFWNVLIGEMSIVGPRPERPEFGAEFAARITGYAERHHIRPGITRLAQVYGSYLTSVYHKLHYDWLYMRRMSHWLDLRILLLTIGAVLCRKGT